VESGHEWQSRVQDGSDGTTQAGIARGLELGPWLHEHGAGFYNPAPPKQDMVGWRAAAGKRSSRGRRRDLHRLRLVYRALDEPRAIKVMLAL
jgi:hypothetical protein